MSIDAKGPYPATGSTAFALENGALKQRIASLEQQLAELRGKVREWERRLREVAPDWSDGRRVANEMRQAVNEPEGGGGEDET